MEIERRDRMYANLANELRNKKITNRVIAELIGCDEKTVFNKLSGKSDFTITEGLLIRHNVLPEFDMDYLFTRNA